MIVTEHSDPAHRPLPASVRLLREVVYRRAAAITVLNDSLYPWAARFGVPTFVMPNPIQPCGPRKVERRGPLTVIAAGRLEEVKGFDQLIDAASLLSPSRDWQIIIVGDGAERRAAGGADRPPRSRRQGSNPPTGRGPLSPPARVGDLRSVLSLRGLRNTLVEAMSAGLACVAFDCPSGPRHILAHGVDGLLVPALDPQALANALEEVIADGALRAALGAGAVETAKTYSVTNVMEEWDRILASVVQDGAISQDPTSMRIALLLRSLGFGGAERQAILLARALSEHGHSVTVFVFYSGHGLESELSGGGVELVDLHKSGRWENTRASFSGLHDRSEAGGRMCCTAS